MFKHLYMKNGAESLSWEAQRDSESEIIKENQQSNNCHKPLEQRGTNRSEHLSSNAVHFFFQLPTLTKFTKKWNYHFISCLPLSVLQKNHQSSSWTVNCYYQHCYVAISERRMGKGKGGQRNQPFVYTPHKRRGPISAGDKCRKSESRFSSLIEIQSRECLINDKKKLSRVLKSWARSHLPAELDWRWVRLKM